MKTFPFIIAALLLFASCQHPDGRKEAQATQNAIGRTAGHVNAAEVANAQAQAHTAAARTLVQQIQDDAQQLLISK